MLGGPVSEMPVPVVPSRRATGVCGHEIWISMTVDSQLMKVQLERPSTFCKLVCTECAFEDDELMQGVIDSGGIKMTKAQYASLVEMKGSEEIDEMVEKLGVQVVDDLA